MCTSRVLHTLPLVGLLSLPVMVNARTINMFETEDGHQLLPENASPMAAEKNPYAEFAAMSISDIIKMEVNGQPVSVQLHFLSEDGTGNGGEIVIYSTEHPEGIVRSEPGELAPPVPLPAAAWLMMSGVVGMAAIARRRHSAEIAG